MKITKNKPYVYIYKNPLKSGKPFYVGKGRNYRYRHHMSPCILKNDSWKSRIILKILKAGKEPDIEIIYCDTDQHAFDLEFTLISQYRLTSQLCNINDGGDSPPQNQGIEHPSFGKSGKFLLTNLNSGISEEVIGIYFWAKDKGLNGRTLVEIADKILLKKPNNKTSIRRQHKDWICERISY